MKCLIKERKNNSLGNILLHLYHRDIVGIEIFMERIRQFFLIAGTLIFILYEYDNDKAQKHTKNVFFIL